MIQSLKQNAYFKPAKNKNKLNSIIDLNFI